MESTHQCAITNNRYCIFSQHQRVSYYQRGPAGGGVCRSVMRSKVCPRDHILYGRNFSSPQQIHEQIMAFSWVRRGLWVLIAALICVSAEKGPESRSGLILELQAALNELVEDGKGYLGKLAGKQTVLSVLKVSYISYITVCLALFLLVVFFSLKPH